MGADFPAFTGLVLILEFRVNVRIASIASFLPSSEDNNATFIGTTGGPCTGPTLTPVEENRVRLQQMEVQKQDAYDRRIVYDAEGTIDEDAEGIDDPDYVGANSIDDTPIGMRITKNDIVPLPANAVGTSRNQAGSTQLMDEDPLDVNIGNTGLQVFPGNSVDTAGHVRQLVSITCTFKEESST
jgi:hypothetical protein